MRAWLVVGFARAGLGLEVVWAGVRELSGVARVLQGSRAQPGINFFLSLLILLRLTKASAAYDGPERA